MTDSKRAQWSILRPGDRVRITDGDGHLYVNLSHVDNRDGYPVMLVDEHGDQHYSDRGADIRLLRRPLTDAMAQLDLPTGVTLATVWEDDSAEPIFELTDGKRTYRAVFHWEAQTLWAEVTRWHNDDGSAFELGRYVMTPLGFVFVRGDADAVNADDVNIRKVADWIYDQD